MWILNAQALYVKHGDQGIKKEARLSFNEWHYEI